MSAWHKVGPQGVMALERLVLKPLREDVKSLHRIAGSPAGKLTAWQLATDDLFGQEFRDGLLEWSRKAVVMGHEPQVLLQEHTELQSLLKELEHYRDYGNEPFCR